RTMIKPSQEGAVAIQLYNLIAAKAGQPTLTAGVDVPHLQKAADDLWAARGNARVVAGSNDKAIQVVVNGINSMVGSYGTTRLTPLPVNCRQGDEVAMVKFIDALHSGRIAGVIF